MKSFFYVYIIAAQGQSHAKFEGKWEMGCVSFGLVSNLDEELVIEEAMAVLCFVCERRREYLQN